MPDLRNKLTTHAIVTGISGDVGLEAYLIKERAINQDHFKEFIRLLKDKYADRDLCLFMDNLSVHKARAVRAVYREQGITPIFNVPYSP